MYAFFRKEMYMEMFIADIKNKIQENIKKSWLCIVARYGNTNHLIEQFLH